MPGPLKRLLAIGLACVAGHFLFWPVPFDPARWASPPIARPAAKPVAFTAEAPWSVVGPGPEDITRGHDGLWYTGLDDGRILPLNQDGTSRVVATTGGRPLGVRQLPDGSLIVADAFQGLLRGDQAGPVGGARDSGEGRRQGEP